MIIKRFLISFLLILLPLQFAQAAICSYCEFDLDVAPQHEVTQAQQVSVADLGQHSHDQQGNGLHNGCGVCHLCCAKLVSSQPDIKVISTNPTVTATYIIHQYPLVLSGIERPNWQLAV